MCTRGREREREKSRVTVSGDGKVLVFLLHFFLELKLPLCVVSSSLSLADSIDYYSFSLVLSAVYMCVITSITWFLLIADFGSNIISLHLFLISRNNIMRTIYTQSIQIHFSHCCVVCLFFT